MIIHRAEGEKVYGSLLVSLINYDVKVSHNSRLRLSDGLALRGVLSLTYFFYK